MRCSCVPALSDVAIGFIGRYPETRRERLLSFPTRPPVDVT